MGCMDKQILKSAILRTLAYFDLSNYPLTATEINQWLYQLEAPKYHELLSVLQEMVSQNQLEEKFGFFYLPNREVVVEERRRSLVISELKLKKARRAVKFISHIPFLRAIFVCNTVAAGSALEESDIDFFIIAQAGRIWLVRFFTNLILRFFGLRTYGEKQRDKICLSFFVDTNNLNLSKLQAVEDDIHFAYWSFQMLPIYDPGNYWKKFLSANYWIKKYIPNFSNNAVYSKIVNAGPISKIWKKIWEVMWFGAYGDLLEKQAREWQILKMKLSIKDKTAIKDNGVVFNEGVIKLHEHDSRSKIKNAWQDKTAQLLKKI